MNSEYEKAIQLLDNMIDAGASGEEILNLPQFGVIENEQVEPQFRGYSDLKQQGWRKLVDKEDK